MLNQINLISAICKELEKQGLKSLVPRQYNAVIEAANLVIQECDKQPVMTTAGMGIHAWLASDDVGASSKYMASVLRGKHHVNYAHPHDAADFGRCVRLLDAVPEFRPLVNTMANKSPEWARLVDCWEAAEAAVRANDYKTANDLVTKAVYPNEVTS